jgi:hypothetical protein
MDTPNSTPLQCTECGEFKPATTEYFLQYKNGHLRRPCKACLNKRSAKWRAENPNRKSEYEKAWYAEHSERQRERRKVYYYTNHERVLDYARTWGAANKEAIAERRKNDRQEIRDRRNARSRSWYAENREYAAQYAKAYNEANPDVRRAQEQRRRAREAQAGGTISASDLADIRAAQTDSKGRLICWRCGKPIKSNPHLDHWIPLAKGGTNDAGNLHYMHAKCNMTKHTKHPTDIGRLL